MSDRHVRKYPGYLLDERCRARPGPNTPTINFQQLKDILLSTDLSRNEELAWIKDNSFRFLDGQDMKGNQVALQSFPRTGNSFSRRFIEQITGVFTGADMNIE